MRTFSRLFSCATAAVVVGSTLTGCSLFEDEPADLQVYSSRHYGSEEVFKQFTEDTGISVEFITGDSAALVERIKKEGEDSPADVYMTVDAGSLWNAADQGILTAIDDPALVDDVAPEFRDPQNRWFGLMMRARTTIYNPEKVDPSEFDAQETYKGLADPKWKGRLCMRDDSETYTSALVAGLIDQYGRDEALEIVKGWVANDVQIMGNDVELIKAVSAGTCEVALTNHYYLARSQAEGDYENVELYWASQDGAGTIANLSGAGVVSSSDNKSDAQELIDWLASPKGQAAMMEGNHEFPVNPTVEPDEYAARFGDFKPAPIDAEAFGKYNAEALDLLTEAGYRD